MFKKLGGLMRDYSRYEQDTRFDLEGRREMEE